jgi:23S rRNA pseudouridine2605 synthase
VDKVYNVLLNRLPTSKEIQQLKEGISIEEGITSPAQVQLIQKTPEIWLSVQIHEGKKRQVRRMLEAVGCSVKRLIRVKIGSLDLEGLSSGRWRLLTPKEATTLRREVRL